MPVLELETSDDLQRAFPVLKELRGHLNEDDYLTTVREMMKRGYRLFALEDEGDIVALAGISVGLNFYYGPYVWVYDLITSEKVRSRGYGQELLSRIEKVAEDEGCKVVALSSALFRTDAHRFYEERMGYQRAAYVFVKELDAKP